MASSFFISILCLGFGACRYNFIFGIVKTVPSLFALRTYIVINISQLSIDHTILVIDLKSWILYSSSSLNRLLADDLTHIEFENLDSQGMEYHWWVFPKWIRPLNELTTIILQTQKARLSPMRKLSRIFFLRRHIDRMLKLHYMHKTDPKSYGTRLKSASTQLSRMKSTY